MASLEEILAYKAAEKAQEGDAVKNAGTVLGATGGSLLGMMAGMPVHNASQALGEIQGAGATRQSLKALKPGACLLYTSPSPRDRTRSRMPSSA